MMLYLTTIVSRAKNKWHKAKKVKKLALNSQLLTVQILTNDAQVLILSLSYFITTVCTDRIISISNTISSCSLLHAGYIKPLVKQQNSDCKKIENNFRTSGNYLQWCSYYRLSHIDALCINLF